nr:TonB-dependent receptor plug domain-containing protein [Novosphingobium sp. KN65.2]
MQAVSAQEITRAGVSRPEDIAKLATGVTVGTGDNVPQIYIRGVGNYATNNYAESAIAMNVDGVYVSRGWAARGAFFDLARDVLP